MNTRTRADSRRGRREQREVERDARHARLRILLARADRGVLTPKESALLRGDVEAEITECDTHRRSAGGQQAAAMRCTAGSRPPSSASPRPRPSATCTPPRSCARTPPRRGTDELRHRRTLDRRRPALHP